MGGVMQLHCVGVWLPSMGPRRHSMRVAARNIVDTLVSTAASSLTTPGGVSHISKANLKHLRYLKAKGDLEVEELSTTSEDATATEEFSLLVPALKLDRIKRNLKFCPMSLSVKDLHWDRGTDGNLRAQKVRTKFRLDPDDNNAGESRRGNSKASVSAVKVEKAEDAMDDHKATVNGIIKYEPQDEALTSHTEIDDIVKREPREEAGLRRRKLRSNASAKVTKVKVEEYEELESNSDLHDTGKIVAPQVFSRQKRKSPEQASAGSIIAKKASGRKQDEVVSVRPGRGPQLASERSSAITMLAGPYPTYARPFPEECQQAKDLLSNLHGPLPEYERRKVSCPTIEQHTLVQPLRSLDTSCSATNAGPRRVIKFRVEEIDKVGNMELALATTASPEQGSRPKVMVPKDHPRNRRGVLDSLIGTLLSQNTTDNNSRRAFASLTSTFPTWEEVRSCSNLLSGIATSDYRGSSPHDVGLRVLRADRKDVEDAIRCGGLAEIKTERIRTILGTLLKERGEISLEYIRSMSNEDIKDELSRFKGVGPKTVACVLMFHLQRKEFPVDTHVFRISKMLGWVPERADREKAYLHLNQRIPEALKFDIHCLFVTHGKRCPQCAKRFKRQPSDGECPLLDWKSKWSTRRNGLPKLEFSSAN